MTTYAIGDLQGCGGALQRLLDEITFDPANDKLWFAGDLVNRGPSSLLALRSVRSLGDAAVTVIGNHDLHLLMVMAGFRKTAKKDTLDDILDSAQRDAYFHWLRRQPLLHRDDKLGATLTHAGIYPLWDIRKAMLLAAEVEAVLRGPDHLDFLHALPGKCEEKWHDDLEGIERLRFITAAFTRMRYCKGDGSLEFDFKGPPDESPEHLYPWYLLPDRVDVDDHLYFGHWASHGNSPVDTVVPLDFGCVWGGDLVAIAVESGERFSVDCEYER